MKGGSSRWQRLSSANEDRMFLRHKGRKINVGSTHTELSAFRLVQATRQGEITGHASVTRHRVQPLTWWQITGSCCTLDVDRVLGWSVRGSASQTKCPHLGVCLKTEFSYLFSSEKNPSDNLTFLFLYACACESVSKRERGKIVITDMLHVRLESDPRFSVLAS